MWVFSAADDEIGTVGFSVNPVAAAAGCARTRSVRQIKRRSATEGSGIPALRLLRSRTQPAAAATGARWCWDFRRVEGRGSAGKSSGKFCR
ncbi:hypothetical protein DMW99_29020 [Pseudomonas chlororaphis]|nr:hypothetical protein C1Y36_26645 [Pseudomonas sp. FW306-2-2C-D06C]PYC30407.1 hypothetical protein DMW99_29020 [Pseudomonas chlororaphis]